MPWILNLYIFDGIPDDQINDYLKKAEYLKIKEWETIIKEWDQSNWKWYFLSGWVVEVFMKEKSISELHEGDLFWEIALITDEPRTATIVAKTDLNLLAFNKDDFISLYKDSDHFKKIQKKIISRITSNLRN